MFKPFNLTRRRHLIPLVQRLPHPLLPVLIGPQQKKEPAMYGPLYTERQPSHKVFLFKTMDITFPVRCQEELLSLLLSKHDVTRQLLNGRTPESLLSKDMWRILLRLKHIKFYMALADEGYDFRGLPWVRKLLLGDTKRLAEYFTWPVENGEMLDSYWRHTQNGNILKRNPLQLSLVHHEHNFVYLYDLLRAMGRPYWYVETELKQPAWYTESGTYRHFMDKWIKFYVNSARINMSSMRRKKAQFKVKRRKKLAAARKEKEARRAGKLVPGKPRFARNVKKRTRRVLPYFMPSEVSRFMRRMDSAVKLRDFYDTDGTERFNVYEPFESEYMRQVKRTGAVDGPGFRTRSGFRKRAPSEILREGSKNLFPMYENWTRRGRAHEEVYSWLAGLSDRFRVPYQGQVERAVLYTFGQRRLGRYLSFDPQRVQAYLAQKRSDPSWIKTKDYRFHAELVSDSYRYLDLPFTARHKWSRSRYHFGSFYDKATHTRTYDPLYRRFEKSAQNRLPLADMFTHMSLNFPRGFKFTALRNYAKVPGRYVHLVSNERTNPGSISHTSMLKYTGVEALKTFAQRSPKAEKSLVKRTAYPWKAPVTSPSPVKEDPSIFDLRKRISNKWSGVKRLPAYLPPTRMYRGHRVDLFAPKERFSGAFSYGHPGRVVPTFYDYLKDVPTNPREDRGPFPLSPFLETKEMRSQFPVWESDEWGNSRLYSNPMFSRDLEGPIQYTQYPWKSIANLYDHTFLWHDQLREWDYSARPGEVLLPTKVELKELEGGQRPLYGSESFSVMRVESFAEWNQQRTGIIEKRTGEEDPLVRDAEVTDLVEIHRETSPERVLRPVSPVPSSSPFVLNEVDSEESFSEHPSFVEMKRLVARKTQKDRRLLRKSMYAARHLPVSEVYVGKDTRTNPNDFYTINIHSYSPYSIGGHSIRWSWHDDVLRTASGTRSRSPIHNRWLTKKYNKWQAEMRRMFWKPTKYYRLPKQRRKALSVRKVYMRKAFTYPGAYLHHALLGSEYLPMEVLSKYFSVMSQLQHQELKRFLYVRSSVHSLVYFVNALKRREIKRLTLIENYNRRLTEREVDLDAISSANLKELRSLTDTRVLVVQLKSEVLPVILRFMSEISLSLKPMAQNSTLPNIHRLLSGSPDLLVNTVEERLNVEENTAHWTWFKEYEDGMLPESVQNKVTDPENLSYYKQRDRQMWGLKLYAGVLNWTRPQNWPSRGKKRKKIRDSIGSGWNYWRALYRIQWTSRGRKYRPHKMAAFSHSLQVVPRHFSNPTGHGIASDYWSNF